MSDILVNAAQLKAKAEELSAQNTQLKAQIDLLNETEMSLNAMWEGDANVAFHNAFQRDRIQMTNFYNAIQQYVQVLQNTAVRYSQTELNNAEIASARKY